jgi:hypothetical protein
MDRGVSQAEPDHRSRCTAHEEIASCALHDRYPASGLRSGLEADHSMQDLTR